ncbi:MAG: type II toxin-antitoxin system RelE/ParE family toxin [Candidatus Solibacter sp.]|nr:type II toxin-antitoxin system RelE/ParE family toxin [Candidatus Solibacter sp.]
MIRSFRDREAEKLFQEQFSRKYQSIERTAQRKLTMLDEAATLEDLAALPRLEPLTGGRKGQYSIRINGQYRLCFVWSEGDAAEVEIVDYH